MAGISHFPTPDRSAVGPVGHRAMAADEKRQRKKIQNRLNQRARRLRLREKDQGDVTTNLRPFRVYRWRLENESHNTPGISSKQPSRGPVQNNIDRREHPAPCPPAEPFSNSNQARMVSHRSSETGVSLPADHLLHLIQFNVLRGVHRAKYILAECSAFVIPGIEKDEIRPGHVWFLGTSMFFATRPGLPERLVPTSLQMDILHATWINFLPIPKMRDNLIAKETCYDHADFIRDLLGEKVVDHMFGSL
ncbi:hypothetical protein ABOM_004578 [Aspergillus bombycis]|uniref:Uncharacterized protein n=1 Tax=Aspergillus bombycis TaxID=109264 RepID=A0A1F8A447_9EURO|nr:hypothetical protein ABOM_004578 [Aspergillus bombycis]OGM46512.1 hypothetical protein ABOM_004578 [Aspergillus bombycis]